MEVYQLMYVPERIGRGYLPKPPPMVADSLLQPPPAPHFGFYTERFSSGLDFWANFDLLQETDYPFNSTIREIMSRRMLDVLREVGHFDHEVIPVRLLEHPMWKGRRSEPPWRSGTAPRVAPKRVNTEFAIVLTRRLDVIDWRTTAFAGMRESERGFTAVNPFSSGVVEPESGFPPLFNIQGASGGVMGGAQWVNSEARAALEKAKIKVGFSESPEVRRI